MSTSSLIFPSRNGNECPPGHHSVGYRPSWPKLGDIIPIGSERKVPFSGVGFAGSFGHRSSMIYLVGGH